MTTPTPAHRAFRNRKAQEFANPAGLAKVPLVVEVHMRHDAEKFLAGMEAEFEVARLMGRIEALSELVDENPWALHLVGLEEAKLDALLEGK